jgi:hypothetical protein
MSRCILRTVVSWIKKCVKMTLIIRIDIIEHRIIELPCLYVSLVFSELNTAIAGLNKLKYQGQ